MSFLLAFVAGAAPLQHVQILAGAISYSHVPAETSKLLAPMSSIMLATTEFSNKLE